jgi:hypothetical protein
VVKAKCGQQAGVSELNWNIHGFEWFHGFGFMDLIDFLVNAGKGP